MSELILMAIGLRFIDLLLDNELMSQSAEQFKYFPASGAFHIPQRDRLQTT